MDEKFFEHFKKELFNLEEKPDRGTWESIETRMEKPKDRKRFFIVLSIAATVICLMTVIAVQYSGTQLEEESNSTIQNSATKSKDGLNDVSHNANPTGSSYPTNGNLDSVSRSNTNPTDNSLGSELQTPRDGEANSISSGQQGRLSSVSGQTEGGQDLNVTNGKSERGIERNISSDQQESDLRRTAGPVSLHDQHAEEDKFQIEENLNIDKAIIQGNLVDSIFPQPNWEAVDTDKRKKSNIRFQSLVVSAGTSWSYYNFEANSKDEITLVGIKNVGTFSSDRSGFRINAGAEWNAGTHLCVFTGLVYQSTFYHGAFNTSYYSAGMVNYYNNSNVLIVTPVEQHELVHYDQTRHEIGGAVNVRYYFSQRIMQHSIGLWWNVNKFQSKETFGTESQLEYEGYNSYLSFSYRLEYPMSRNIHLFTEPSFSYQIGSKDKTTSIFKTTQLSTLSLQFGALFSLKK